MLNPYLSVDQQLIGDIYTSRESIDNLEILCDDFGSRFGGTEGERRAVEFFQEKMIDYGLSNVHAEPFEYIGWKRGTIKLEITSPIQKEISCISLPHSPPADIEGEIIDIGDGAPADFDSQAAQIKGKIVMTTSVITPKGAKRWIHRREKFGRSVMAGAKAFIYVNHYPGFGPATGGIGGGQESLIPGIGISKEDGTFIQRIAKRHGVVRIHLTSTDRCEPMTSWNVVGELPGKQNPDQVVLIGSHYDGHDISQGADDPASGVVAVLEAARVLSRYASENVCTIRFILWGVEEIGLIGSKEYVRVHDSELSNIRFYLNMDGAGGKNNNRDVVLNEWPELFTLFAKWRDEMAHDFAIGQSLITFSDHYPFFKNGVPTGGLESVVSASSSGRGYGHTCYDTVDKIELEGLREAASLAARLTMRVANERDWPAARRTKKQVRKLLESPAYQEERAFRDAYEAFLEQNKSR
ncbi:MAG: M28 family peptidase [Anaerolineales bacterium]|nr:M28 family peptidase [Anaerolineales bacterium]